MRFDEHNEKSTSYVDETSVSRLLEFITRRDKTNNFYTVF